MGFDLTGGSLSGEPPALLDNSSFREVPEQTHCGGCPMFAGADRLVWLLARSAAGPENR
jgi:hypothetical protein